MYLVQKGKIFNKNTKIFKKYFDYQVKNGKFLTKIRKSLKVSSIKVLDKKVTQKDGVSCPWVVQD